MTGCATYRSAYCGFLGDLSSLWIVLSITIAIFALVIIPFTIFYYEAYDMDLEDKETSCWKQACQAMRWTFISLFTCGILFLIGFLFLRVIRIPIQATSIDASDTAKWSKYAYGTAFTKTDDSFGGNVYIKNWTSSEITMNATLAVWLIAFVSGIVLFFLFFFSCGGQFLNFSSSSPQPPQPHQVCFIGWIFFLLYASIGLAALPIDLYIDFKRRPTLMKPISYSKAKKQMADRAEELVRIAEELKLSFRKMTSAEKKSTKRERKKTHIRLQQQTLLLEKNWDELKLCEQSNYMDPTWWNSFYPFLALFLSIVGGLVSFLWFLQICIYLLPAAWGGKPLHPFLIAWLEILDGFFPLFATATIGIFVLYLLLCTVKGVFKFGMRFTLLPMHPMRLHKTLANSIAVNVGMVLICTLPTIQFTTSAFSGYIRHTDVNTLYTQVKYLEWCAPIFKNQIFVVGLVAMTVLTAMYGYCCGKSKDESNLEDLKDQLKRLDKKYKKKGMTKKTLKDKDGVGQKTFGAHKEHL